MKRQDLYYIYVEALAMYQAEVIDGTNYVEWTRAWRAVKRAEKALLKFDNAHPRGL